MYLMGGVERTNASLSMLFSLQGHKVTLISFFRNSKTPFFDFGDNEIISLNNSPHGLNQNFLVKDNLNKYFVRIGDDIPEHLVFRANEVQASTAA